jgi:hypothetical protein
MKEIEPHAQQQRNFRRQTQRRDLQDFRNLSRQPVLSYFAKQAAPPAPREKLQHRHPARFPSLGAFSPRRLSAFASEYLQNRFGARHTFQTYLKHDTDQGIYRLLGDDREIRVALCGDWATGTDEAYHVGQRVLDSNPHYTIHLGDVYYVGDEAEVRQNFLGQRNLNNDYLPCCWPCGSNGAYALLGNHDMYARGEAYFEEMLPALGLKNGGGQMTSYFCLENESWRIIGLDTGYNSVGWPLLEILYPADCSLPVELLSWLRDVVRIDQRDDRAIILLSHHQYYSKYDRSYPGPARQLSQLINRPVLWFWGHEHRLVIYKEFHTGKGLRAYGRCIGHGGMPVEYPLPRPQLKECPVEFMDERLYFSDENLRVGLNGFARLAFRNERLFIEYIDLCGHVVFAEEWEAEGGAPTRRG